MIPNSEFELDVLFVYVRAFLLEFTHGVATLSVFVGNVVPTVKYFMDLLLESIKIIRREIQVRQLRLQRYESRLVVKQLNVSVSDLE